VSAASAREPSSGSRPPRVDALRLSGPAAESAKGRVAPPLGARFTSDASAYAVALGAADAVDVATVARALLDPDDLPAGTLLVVLPGVVDPPSLASRFLAALGRGRTVSRSLRSTALVARGYVSVAAGIDDETRSDLVWGYSAGPRSDAR
jgi:hypothetical protein